MCRLLLCAAFITILSLTNASPHVLRGGNPSLQNIMGHLQNLQKIAQSNSNSRSVQNGYNDSAAYVEAQLNQFPDYFSVYKFPFTVPIWKEIEPPQLTLNGLDVPLNLCSTRTGWLHYEEVCDYSGIRYGGSGASTITAKVTRVENEGCADSDWANFPSGNIALVPTGAGCDYLEKAFQAADHGAQAMVMFTGEGVPALPGSRVYRSTWQPGDRISTLPVIGVKYTVAQLLINPDCKSATIRTNQDVTVEYTYNVLAETKAGNKEKVFMIGAHLDSVPEGPGINDNGSGSSVVLELALEFARMKKKTTNVVRFGWWGAEEVGLVGSRNYVDWLVQNPYEWGKVYSYFNFDMEAGPNYVRMVYDGNTAPTPSTIPGSVKIMKLFQDYWSKVGLSAGLSGMGGGSDYLPFLLSGIPAGGMATGAGSHKSDAERALHGGLSNTPFDPCYHAPCDTVDNIAQSCISEIYGAVREVVGIMVNLEDVHTPNRTVPDYDTFHALLQSKLKAATSCNADEEAETLQARQEIHDDL